MLQMLLIMLMMRFSLRRSSGLTNALLDFLRSFCFCKYFAKSRLKIIVLGRLWLKPKNSKTAAEQWDELLAAAVLRLGGRGLYRESF